MGASSATPWGQDVVIHYSGLWNMDLGYMMDEWDGNIHIHRKWVGRFVSLKIPYRNNATKHPQMLSLLPRSILKMTN